MEDTAHVSQPDPDATNPVYNALDDLVGIYVEVEHE